MLTNKTNCFVIVCHIHQNRILRPDHNKYFFNNNSCLIINLMTMIIQVQIDNLFFFLSIYNLHTKKIINRKIFLLLLKIINFFLSLFYILCHIVVIYCIRNDMNFKQHHHLYCNWKMKMIIINIIKDSSLPDHHNPLYKYKRT